MYEFKDSTALEFFSRKFFDRGVKRQRRWTGALARDERIPSASEYCSRREYKARFYRDLRKSFSLKTEDPKATPRHPQNDKRFYELLRGGDPKDFAS